MVAKRCLPHLFIVSISKFEKPVFIIAPLLSMFQREACNGRTLCKGMSPTCFCLTINFGSYRTAERVALLRGARERLIFTTSVKPNF